MDPNAGRIVSIDLAWVLKSLPGLRLNTLTVLGSTHGPTSYMDLQELVRVGNGWRNLHFIAPNSKIFGFPAGGFHNEEPICREPQPGLWDTWVSLCRDGPNSGGSVTIYQSTQSNSPGSVFQTDTRKILKQRSNRRKRGKFGLSEDMSLMSESEVNKEILVIVNRGRNANIKEKDEPPYFLSDIRSWGMTWPEICRERLDSTVPL
ncbi:hypothetical protein N7456_001304 [Penicillium angulare]|uniref:Uncharacterized protein n=1 Tax=Penicillium angulare TaxID=116970 RepID=A0A9W9KT60_9EURO|nr:hypothetical protein N7456_001304 [Penicillium angulare]